jgi:hypothetical protein
MRRVGLGLLYWVASINPVAWAEIPRWLPALAIALGVTLIPTASRADRTLGDDLRTLGETLRSAEPHLNEIQKTLQELAQAARPACIPLDVFRQILDNSGASYDILNITRTEAASLLADEVTGTEPPSKWTVAVIALDAEDAEGKRQLFMAFGRDGAICRRLNVPEDGVKTILRRVYGWRV